MTRYRRIFFIIFNLLFTSSVHSQQWYPTYSPRGRDINSVVILNESNISAAGGNEFNAPLQGMFFSNNVGLSWEMNPADTINGWIKSIAFTDSLYGIGVGFDGKILRTNDGGQIWFRIPSPTYARHFNKVFFVDSLIGYTAGGLRVNDSIQTIDTIMLTVDSIQTILKTLDGGDTWNVIYDQSGPWLKSIYFTDALNGIAVGDEGIILKTTNGGTSWTPVATPVQRDFNQVTFISNQTGYIVGGHWSNDTMRTILRTTNGGNSWTILIDETGGWFTDISFMNADTGHIVGYQATLWQTTNGGLTWMPEAIPGSSPAFPFGFFNTVRFFNKDFGVIGGSGGEMYVFTHSGLPDAYTLGFELLDSASVKLRGAVNANGYPALYSFVYTNDFTGYIAETYPADFPVDRLLFLEDQFHQLNSDATYYFLIKTWTHAGTAYGDTLTFFTGTDIPAAFSTLSATDIANTSARLNGSLRGFNDNIDLHFEYGPTLDFGSQIAANPSAVNDTLPHAVDAMVSSLQPNQNYFFRLRGVGDSGSYYGNTYLVRAPFDVLNTLPVVNPSEPVVTLNGVVSGAQYPADLNFNYSTNVPNFGLNASAGPHQVNDSLLHTVSAYLNTDSSTLYFFRLQAKTILGDFFGDTTGFLARAPTGLHTLSATNVSLSSAQLNGNAEMKGFPAFLNYNLSFEYGITQAFGSEIQSIPSFIADTLYHDLSATISGLQSNTAYYYRIKATTNAGPSLYGDIKQVYLGQPTIPNWDFQNWDNDTTDLPYGWFLGTDKIERVPGHAGNYALKLFDQNLAALGKLNKDLRPGVPFNARPDSIVAWIKYDLSQDSLTGVVVTLLNQGNTVAQKNCLAMGSSGGDFKRLAFKIDYQSALTPDTLAIMIFMNDFNGTMEIDDIHFTGTVAPVPNGDFETWFSYPNQRLQNWEYLKFMVLDTFPLSDLKMVTQTFYNSPTDFAAEIHNVDINGQQVFFNGNIATSQGIIGSPVPSFPVYSRHITLNGYFKNYPLNGDTMSILIAMTKDGEFVGDGSLHYTDSVTQFEPFSIPINYIDSLVIPDSALIAISCSKGDFARGASRVIIDKLSFDGFYNPDSINSITAITEDKLPWKIYPNPGADRLFIEVLSAHQQTAGILIFDLTGKIVHRSQTFLSGSRSPQVLSIPLENFTSGAYLVAIRYEGGFDFKKLIITK